jgi:hypothetical protein
LWYDDIHSGWYEHRYKYSDTDIKWSDCVCVAICAVSGDSGYRSDDKWYSTICERWHSYSVSDVECDWVNQRSGDCEVYSCGCAYTEHKYSDDL